MADRDRIQVGDRVRVELIGTETAYTGQVKCVVSYAVRVKLDGCPTMLAQTFGGPDWRVEVIEEGDREISLQQVHPMDRAYQRGIVIGMLNRGATGVEAMWALVDDQGMGREEAKDMVAEVMGQSEGQEKFEAAEREVRRQIKIKDGMAREVEELEHLLQVAQAQREQASRGWTMARERISGLELELARVRMQLSLTRLELRVEQDRRDCMAQVGYEQVRDRMALATEMIKAGHGSRIVQSTLCQEFNIGWDEAGDLVAGLEHDLLGQGG